MVLGTRSVQYDKQPYIMSLCVIYHYITIFSDTETRRPQVNTQWPQVIFTMGSCRHMRATLVSRPFIEQYIIKDFWHLTLKQSRGSLNKTFIKLSIQPKSRKTNPKIAELLPSLLTHPTYRSFFVNLRRRRPASQTQALKWETADASAHRVPKRV